MHKTNQKKGILQDYNNNTNSTEYVKNLTFFTFRQNYVWLDHVLPHLTMHFAKAAYM